MLFKLRNNLTLTILLIFVFSVLVSNASDVEALGVSAKGAILIEEESGRVLFKKNEHQQMRIASITKIMTAIIAVESGKMDETVTVSNLAAGTEGSSIYIEAGEKKKLEDLVYGLMLRSGNDAAVAIAEHVGGSLEGFVFLMNQKAAEIGMSNTNFANPHGLDDHEEHYSTAYDMAILTQYAMKNKKFREIFGTKQYNNWRNKNKLLTGMYKYSTGGKTGYTKRAKRTLVSTAKKDDMSLIAVTINASDDWNDHMSMFNWAFNTYDLVTVIDDGKITGVKSEYYKNNIEVVRELTYPLTKKERKQVTNKITLIKPPTDRGWEEEDIPSPVGKLRVYLNKDKIGDLPIYFDGAAKVDDEPAILNKIKDVWNRFFYLGSYLSEGTNTIKTNKFWDDQFYG